MHSDQRATPPAVPRPPLAAGPPGPPARRDDPGPSREPVPSDGVPPSDAAPASDPAGAGVTGDRAVDAALALLGPLDAMPVREHVRVFDRVHTALQARLADVGD